MDKLDKVAKKIMLNVDDNVSGQLFQEWNEISSKLDLLKSFDAQEIEPMVRISTAEESYLREDVVDNPMNKEDILNNSKNSNNDFIVIPKVVKND